MDTFLLLVSIEASFRKAMHCTYLCIALKKRRKGLERNASGQWVLINCYDACLTFLCWC